MDTESIKAALKTVKFPGFSRDIISFGLVREVELTDGEALIGVEITTGDAKIPEQIAADIKSTVGALEGIKDVKVRMEISQPKNQPSPNGANGSTPTNSAAMQKVKFAIAVASGKGGVGKSTVTVNLACALQRLLEADGKAGVGIMDCDIYGPSIPLMLGAAGRPEIENDLIVPLQNFGVSTMSMGFLVDEDTPVVWRGPMIMKTIQQFAQNVEWGELEILVVDLPPGTGDAQLSLVQTIPLDGAVIVTTPQPAASNVARRGARMFERVNVPYLGVVENMSYLEGADGTRQHLFGEGGGAATATALETPLLGEIPIDTSIRIGCDNGIPIVVSDPESAAAKEFFKVAQQIIDQLNA
ncbi:MULTISPECIES: P-loop NTPase [unclassified Lentimonas]|uniref:Mrp/NBP35 family ATP-binding protein n=1 Tax=unclassified Lentimonas TaxID=2630993 RepID=UPI00132C5056|nr:MULTISPECIES: P-loop NTPase [unclassified Lentimonas]CAA6691885.1 PUTATIVE MRP PROTEIN HOMOLOG ATP-BINDING [Lentimonas sp. CC19]CAA6694630.1 PUTATIVE MRP PROTEIN HOMOLOG ATP-BINDING [Lentimonas sp. CC10]CAA7072145.1 PUTATIVE MRP PROTEIN HOMOLOG ATP-BINDING [Lentimonas sp. CC11]